MSFNYFGKYKEWDYEMYRVIFLDDEWFDENKTKLLNAFEKGKKVIVDHLWESMHGMEVKFPNWLDKDKFRVLTCGGSDHPLVCNIDFFMHAARQVFGRIYMEREKTREYSLVSIGKLRNRDKMDVWVDTYKSGKSSYRTMKPLLEMFPRTWRYSPFKEINERIVKNGDRKQAIIEEFKKWYEDPYFHDHAHDILFDHEWYPATPYNVDNYDWQLPKQIMECKYNILVESRTDDFITEKTWKPIVAKVPFFDATGERRSMTLRSMGFETFEDEFGEGNVLQRMENFTPTNDTDQKVQHNFNHFMHLTNDPNHMAKKVWETFNV